MKRGQRFRYEMFVRVRDFGTTNRDTFPESSSAGQLFGQVTSAAATVEDQLRTRTVARASAQKVKTGTRAAVLRYMRRIARTARELALSEAGVNLFKVPERRSSPVVLSAARAFIQEASPRQADFIRLGLPPTFLSDFQKLVNDLDAAVTVQLNSQSLRRAAQAGIETALGQGMHAIHTLDVIVSNQLPNDPVRLAAWSGARRIEGMTDDTSTKGHVPPPVPAPTPVPPASPDQPSAPVTPPPVAAAPHANTPVAGSGS